MKTAIAVSLLALQTLQPGQMTQARVWVQNKNSEAIPIDLHAASISVPLNVHVVNGLPGSPTTAPVLVRATRQQWEYQTVDIPAGADVPAILSTHGMTGWETTGITWPYDKGTAFLLKRPR